MTMQTMIHAKRNGEYMAVKMCLPAPHYGTGSWPIHIGFLIDTSGSMEGERLMTVKQTLHAARDLFERTDKVTLVSFAAAGTMVADKQTMDDAGKEEFYRRLDAMVAHGNTNMSAGLEQLASAASRFDAIVILTDGHINGGIQGAGLVAMITGVARGAPVHLLGYGADHNRVLLRKIATQSRGSYTYIDREDTLPVAIGDIIAGVRGEVLHKAVLTVSGGWICQEVGAEGAEYNVGGVVAQRDYWAVFKKGGDTGEPGPVALRLEGQNRNGGREIYVTTTVADEASDEIQEQIYRCRVAACLTMISDKMETPHYRTRDEDRATLVALRDEINGLSEEIQGRPLMLRMKGQIEEIIAAIPEVSDLLAGSYMASPDLLARISSGGAVLSTQRGVMSQDPDAIGLAPTFSSPAQRTASEAVRSVSGALAAAASSRFPARTNAVMGPGPQVQWGMPLQGFLQRTNASVGPSPLGPSLQRTNASVGLADPAA